MKGKFVLNLKRILMPAIAIALMSPMLSCSKKPKETLQADFGFTQCDGDPNSSFGSFDVYVSRSKASPGMFELRIITVQAANPGDIATITIANENLGYKQLIPQVVLQDGQEIFAGTLTQSDLYEYTQLAIAPYDPSSNFVNQTPSLYSGCYLPTVGDGVPESDYNPVPY